MNCWEILQIEYTKDVKIIKHAYAEMTKQYHPEENPEKFKEIQAAYKQAIAYAKNQISSSQKINVANKESDVKSQLKKTLSFFKQEETVSEEKYFEGLFQEREREKEAKIAKYSNYIKREIELLIQAETYKSVYLWREFLRKEEFQLALYDEAFTEFLHSTLSSHKDAREAAFEVYYYFLKSKKADSWNEADKKLNNYLQSCFT